MKDTEIDVSPLLASPGFDPWDCSNSVANLGQNAGKLTWRASQRHASALTSALANLKPGRSAWSRGVHAYAVELVESLDAPADLSNETLLHKALLNGADDWQQYSEGGCALVYDADIAERLCSASELKRCKGGERQPNARENWIERQARALSQAASLVRRAYRKATGGAS